MDIFEKKFKPLFNNKAFSACRKRIFACRWADLHNSAGIGSPWVSSLSNRKPEYGLGNAKPALFMELKANSALGQNLSAYGP